MPKMDVQNGGFKRQLQTLFANVPAPCRLLCSYESVLPFGSWGKEAKTQSCGQFSENILVETERIGTLKDTVFFALAFEQLVNPSDQ